MWYAASGAAIVLTACGWLELRGQDGSTSRLVPSPRLDARVSGPGLAARKLSHLALDLIGLTRTDQEDMERHCSTALARAAEIQQSAAPGTAGDLPGQLTRLCAFLTGHGPADGESSFWTRSANGKLWPATRAHAEDDRRPVPEPVLRQPWLRWPRGTYLGVPAQAQPARPHPDLHLFG